MTIAPDHGIDELHGPADTLQFDMSDISADGLTDPGSIWHPRYDEFNKDIVLEKLVTVEEQLALQGLDRKLLETEGEVARQFIDRVYDEFENGPRDRDPGTFAFMVPTRTDRQTEYGDEWLQFFPQFSHIDPVTRQLMLVGIPPYVVDQYEPGLDEEGQQRRGYMLFGGVFPDMISDYSDDPLKGLEVLNTNINLAADFAKRLGVSTIGLGAILPKLTNMGNDIQVEGITTTTGHAGTVYLIGETFREHVEVFDPSGKGVTIVGAGSIGRATAVYLRQELGYEGEIFFSDPRPELLEQLKNDPEIGGQIRTTTDNAEAMTAKDVIISAVSSSRQFDFKAAGLTEEQMKGKIIIDDSQPGFFDRAAVEELGAKLVWIIGQDTTGGLITRESFTYSGFGPAAQNEIWGCEAEAAAVALTKRLDLALRKEATPDNVREIGQLLKQLRIRPARPQAQGQYIDLAA